MSLYFEFMDWKNAFSKYYELEKEGLNLRLVVSTHWAPSGYWIEDSNHKLGEGDIAYIGKEIHELEKRIISEFSKHIVRPMAISFIF